jgi:hypothetical protein
MCPSCGSTERLDEDTISGVVGESQQRDWTLELLVEVLERAVSLQRWEDVERMLRRARLSVDERIDNKQPLTRAQVDGFALAAARLSQARGQAEWARWALSIHASLGWVPRDEVLERLSTLPPAERASLVPVAHQVIENVQAQGGPSADDATGFRRVQSLTLPPAAGETE